MDAAQVGKNKKEYGMKMDKILNAYLPLRGRNTASEPDRAKRDKVYRMKIGVGAFSC